MYVSSTVFGVVVERRWAHIGIRNRANVLWNNPLWAERLAKTFESSPRRHIYSSCVKAFGLEMDHEGMDDDLSDRLWSVIKELKKLFYLHISGSGWSLTKSSRTFFQLTSLKSVSLRSIKVDWDLLRELLLSRKDLKRPGFGQCRRDRRRPSL
jgi:hypothetical protein